MSVLFPVICEPVSQSGPAHQDPAGFTRPCPEVLTARPLLPDSAETDAAEVMLYAAGSCSQCLSVAQLHRMSERFSATLISQGVKAGSTLVLMADNSPAWLAVLLAGWELQVTVVPLNTDMAPAQVQSIVDSLQPGFVVLEALRLGFWQSLKTQDCTALLIEPAAGKAILNAVSVAGAVPVLRNSKPVRCPDGACAALVFHSSGSTGAPKAITYSRRSLLTFLEHLDSLFECFPDCGYPSALTTPSARLNTLPMAHFGGLSYCLQALRCGRSLLLLNHPAPEEMVEVIEENQIQLLMTIPAQMKLLLPYLAQLPQQPIEYCLLMGEGASQALISDIQATLDTRVYSAYGMSECLTGLLHPWSLEHPMPPASCGRAGFGELKLVDTQGRESSAVGELWVRNATTVPCYLDPELNARKFFDGWYKTGDCLSCDAAGNYYYQGRVDDMVVINGRNLYPHEVEELLCAHPDVTECVAVLFNNTTGMKLGVIVVLRTGAKVPILELLDFYLARGALYATPSWVMLSTALPRLASGKLDRVRAAGILQEDFTCHTQSLAYQ